MWFMCRRKQKQLVPRSFDVDCHLCVLPQGFWCVLPLPSARQFEGHSFGSPFLSGEAWAAAVLELQFGLKGI